MRICFYEYCDIDITIYNLRIRYCCIKHRDKQHVLNRTRRYINKEKKKIERKKVINESKIPTRIIPQAGRYQDLLIYSTTVMSNFE